MKLSHSIALGIVLSAGSLVAAPVCPTTTSTTGTDASGCSILITFDATGTPTIATTNIGPYDGSEDVTVGVINNAKTAISSVTLSSSAGTNAFGFEGDGIETFKLKETNGVAIGTPGTGTGYEGPTSTFDVTGVVGGDGTLVVNFNPGIAAGGTSYFSLEGTPTIGGGITVVGGGPTGGSATPEPASLALFGSGLVGLGGVLLRRRSNKQ